MFADKLPTCYSIR